MKFSRVILSLLLLAVVHIGLAQNIPAKPNPPRLVNDFADVLSPDEEARLEKALVAYDDSTSNQVAVVLVKTLNDYPIEEYALKILRDWGIGNKKTNNGVLILAAIDDRKIRIEVGYGLEGAIPDVTASRIIRNDIQPNFRRSDYYSGLEAAAASIIQAATGEYSAPPGYAERGEGKGTGGNVIGMVIIFIIIIIVLSNINKGGGGGFMSRRGYRGYGPTIFWPGGGWSGGGGGGGGWSGGGGGFGGFGGGSGGGGGASGSW